MPVRLSEILEHDAPHLSITNRRRLLSFYGAMVEALKKGELTPEGGALPTTLNTLLALLPGHQSPAKRDRELTDWSVENDARYAAFLDGWRARTAASRTRAPKPRAVAAPLHQAVTHLKTLRAQGAKKADLEGAVDVFLELYALSQHVLRLPDVGLAPPRELPEGIEVDESRVSLGNDAHGRYVGLIRKRRGGG